MATQAMVKTENQFLQDALITFLAGRCENTRIAYEGRVSQFMGWLNCQPPAPFLAHLRNYIGWMGEHHYSARSIQSHVATIKGLLRTAAALDTSGQLAQGLPQLDLVKPPAVRGELQGHRLTAEQRQALINKPGVGTRKGLRDTCILLLLSLCGLRRSEICALNWSHIAELDGHHVLANLKGKHGRVRTIKLPPPLWRLLMQWGKVAQLDMGADSPVFVACRRGDVPLQGHRLSVEGVFGLVRQYGSYIGHDEIAPHDLRRTAAKLARKAGASIEQVQHLLGHASPQTTSQYIGETLDLDDNAVDYDSGILYPQMEAIR